MEETRDENRKCRANIVVAKYLRRRERIDKPPEGMRIKLLETYSYLGINPLITFAIILITSAITSTIRCYDHPYPNITQRFEPQITTVTSGDRTEIASRSSECAHLQFTTVSSIAKGDEILSPKKDVRSSEKNHAKIIPDESNPEKKSPKEGEQSQRTFNFPPSVERDPPSSPLNFQSSPERSLHLPNVHKSSVLEKIAPFRVTN
ncbi:hypothetical protein K0M31_002748 [Melipona bicolor]|uniref:Uncharacterized protein n=1 Tax=Melipona bicolor TaxID=60889 RepID=A0AA40KPS6_9HYME|nr:hypothetical protein K0M31_002748 [Melipona bicolor]